MIRKHAAFFAAAITLASAAPAFAQSPSPAPLDKDADADRLFKEGQKLMEEHRFADACPKLESAYRKDNQLGTLLNLAYCHKEMGSTWIAWTEFREAETKAIELKRNDRRDFARERMKELEKNLSRLIVDPTTKYEITEVDLEDRKIFDAEKGIAFAAEPGQRKVTFHAKGKKPGVILVSVASPKESREKVQHVQVPDLADEDPTPPPAEPTTVVAAPPPPEAPRSTWSKQKTLAVVAGGVGVAGIAVGSVFGLLVITGKCDDGPVSKGGRRCDAADRNSASTQGAVATVGFIAGGALIAGGVALFLTAPKNHDSGRGAISGPTVQADIGPTWAGLHGTF